MHNDENEPFKDMKILVIDDDKNALLLLNHILKERFIIETLNNSRVYLEHIERFKPDLVLLDVMMPEVSGLDICRALQTHAIFSDLPLILITAKVDDKDVFEGLEAGAVDYVKKPFSEIELIARIHSALKLELSKRKLKIANTLKDSFLSMVSHDIRTPLTSIMGFSELLLEEKIAGGLNEKQKSLVLQILSSAQHQSRIIKDLLSLSVLETGKLILKKEIYLLEELLKITRREVLINLEKKHIELISDFDEDFALFCDKDRLVQVLINLVSNAIKFTAENGQIIIRARHFEEYDEVAVQDFGVGISEENMERIFNDLEMFTTKGTSGEKGTGLGITICKKIIKSHGGDLFVDSHLGKGSTFYFQIPKTT